MEPTPESSLTVTAAAFDPNVPLDKIKPSPYQPRKYFSEESLLELTQNIQRQGLIEPLTLRLLPDGTYELIGGERRLRAVKRLGWTTVKAQILPVDDQKAAELALIDNLQRVDLNALERAQGYKRLEDMGFSLEVIASKMGGGDRSTISRYLSLLDLPQEVQDLLPRGNISETHTRSIRQIPDKVKQIELARQADKEGWSVKETEKRVNALLGNPQKAGGKGQKGGQKPEEAIVDPAADVWSKAKADMDFIRETFWEVKYGPYKTEQGFMKDGWNFWISPRQHVRAELAVALRKLSDAVAATADPEELKEAALSSEEQDRKLAQVNQQIAQTTLNMLGKIRLPQTPQEQAELENVSVRGPRAVMEWIYGQGSPLVLASPLSWKEIGEPDPAQGLKGILDGIRRTQAAAGAAPAPAPQSAPAAAPVPPAVSSPPAAQPPVDEEKARRIAALKAKYGRIL